MTDGVALEAADADAVAGDAAFWSLYEAAFPREEREPRAVILDAARAGVGLIARARRGGTTVGLASAHLLIDPPAVFLVYLAIDPALRGRGLGAALLEFVWHAAAERQRGDGREPGCLIWEVDRPAHARDDVERRRREKRIAFFQRTGGATLDHPYAQPPLDGGTTPVPMQLMARPRPADVTALVRAIYFEKYGARNGVARAQLQALLDVTG